MIQLILISLAIASTTITIKYFLKWLTNRLPTNFLRKLFHCPYCLSHYLSLMSALYFVPWTNYFDLIIKTMALVALSSIVSLPILMTLNLLDENE